MHPSRLRWPTHRRRRSRKTVTLVIDTLPWFLECLTEDWFFCIYSSFSNAFSKCFVFFICSCYIFWYSHLFLYSTPCFGPRFEMNHFLLFPNMLSEIPLNMPDQFEWNFMKDNKWLFLKNLYTVQFFIILPCNQSMSCQPLSPIKCGVRTVQHAVLR